MTTGVRILVLGLSLVGLAWYTTAASPIRLQVSPRLGTPPLTVAALVFVEPHDANRELCLYWGLAGEDMYNVSCQSLEGAYAKRSYRFPRTLRESGTWDVVAEVRRSDESRSRVSEQVMVIGGW
jgi:hypothetical protein